MDIKDSQEKLEKMESRLISTEKKFTELEKKFSYVDGYQSGRSFRMRRLGIWLAIAALLSGTATAIFKDHLINFSQNIWMRFFS